MSHSIADYMRTITVGSDVCMLLTFTSIDYMVIGMVYIIVGISTLMIMVLVVVIVVVGTTNSVV